MEGAELRKVRTPRITYKVNILESYHQTICCYMLDARQKVTYSTSTLRMALMHPLIDMPIVL